MMGLARKWESDLKICRW